MRKKNRVKIVLDIIMILLLVLMYKKKVLGLSFHEIGGLTLCGLFLIHKALNWKWIRAVSARLLQKELPTKIRFEYMVDVLLLASITFTAISGIFISETILTNISSNNIIWKVGHPFAAALALVLAGIHLGLHWGFIKQRFKKLTRIPKVLQTPLTALCLAAILLFGGYNIAASSFSQWLYAPFAIASVTSGGPSPNNNETGLPPTAITENGGNTLRTATESTINAGNGGGKGLHKGQGDGNGRNSQISFSNTMNTLGSYLSIALFFAVITYWAEKLMRRRKNTSIAIKA